MKKISGLRLLVLFSAVLAGGASCSHRQPPPPRPGPVVMHGDWVRLGERQVDGTHDRDVIHVGAREGRYRRIMLVVEHSALELYDVVVPFGDGELFSPATRHVFGANTRSHVID